VTAYVRDDDKARALAAGFDAHVSKPMSAKELLAVVERLIGIKN
jgi:CheY-like chemotaxis protein